MNLELSGGCIIYHGSAGWFSLGVSMQLQSDGTQGWSHLKTPLSWMYTPISGAAAGMAGTAGDELSILVSPHG